MSRLSVSGSSHKENWRSFTVKDWCTRQLVPIAYSEVFHRNRRITTSCDVIQDRFSLIPALTGRKEGESRRKEVVAHVSNLLANKSRVVSKVKTDRSLLSFPFIQPALRARTEAISAQRQLHFFASAILPAAPSQADRCTAGWQS